jgi:thymidylate kinase
MIVEFIGAPGSGKSTMVPTVQEYLNRRGYQAYSILEAARPFAKKTRIGKFIGKVFSGKLRSLALWQLFYFFSYFNRTRFSIKNEKFIQSVIQKQSARPISKTDRNHVLHWFIHLTGYYEFFNQQIELNEVIIYDEGFVHRVVQMFASEKEEPDYQLVSEYLDSIPKPDLVIFTDAPVEVCIERVFSRGVWERFMDKSPEDTKKFIRRAHKIVNFAVDYIHKLGWKIVVVDNGAEDVSVTRMKLNQSLTENVSKDYLW